MHMIWIGLALLGTHAEMPQLPMNVSARGRDVIRDFELERGLAKTGELFDFTKTKTGLSYLSARAGADRGLIVRNIEAASEGTVVRRTYTISPTGMPSGPNKLTVRTGRQGETLIRVEAREPRPGVSFVASDTYGVEVAGQRQLRIRREHVDGQSRYTINKNELSFADRPWRAYQAASPDEVILDAAVSPRGAKVISYNKKTDTYQQTTLAYDPAEKDPNPVSKSVEVLALADAKSMGLVAELKTIPPVKSVGTELNAPSNMHAIDPPADPDSAR